MSEDSVYSPLGTDISTGEIVDGAVATAKIADAAVTTAKVADGAITDVKLSVSHLWQLEGEVVTTAISQDITFTGLDLETDKIYIIVIRSLGDTDSSSHITHLFVNGDTTLTNYHTQQIVTDGSTVSTANNNTGRIFYASPSSYRMGVIFLTKIAGQYPVATVKTEATDSGSIWIIGWVHNNTSNVTSITLHSEANTYPAGSTISLYKG